MYLTAPSHRFGGFHAAFHQAQAVAPARVCPSSEPIDNKTALLYTDLAPLAAVGRGCDNKAIWTYVPDSRPSHSVHVYLHGNDNLVTASAIRPGGRHADWAPRRTPSSLRPGGPFAAGPKYEMDISAQASAQKPIVLVPEDAGPPGPDNPFWAVGKEGAFAGDPTRLGAMIDDCFRRLQTLRSPSGAPYLNGDQGRLRRLYLSGHSGGGKPLSVCSESIIARSIPTDLWLYDCTYWGAHVDKYVAFANAWAASNRLGNGSGSSRMVILVTGDPRTTNNAVAIIRALERSFRTRRVRLTRRGLPAPGGMLLEAMPDATVRDILNGLRSFAVTLIHTVISHDQIPRVWTPRLLATAN